MTTLAAITHYLEETLQTPIKLHTITTKLKNIKEYAQIHNIIFGIGNHPTDQQENYFTILHNYKQWDQTPEMAANCITNARLRHMITTHPQAKPKDITTINLCDPDSIDQIITTLRSLISDPPTTSKPTQK